MAADTERETRTHRKSLSLGRIAVPKTGLARWCRSSASASRRATGSILEPARPRRAFAQHRLHRPALAGSEGNASSALDPWDGLCGIDGQGRAPLLSALIRAAIARSDRCSPARKMQRSPSTALGGDLIGALEADNADVARQAIRVFRDQPDGVGAVGLEYAHRP